MTWQHKANSNHGKRSHVKSPHHRTGHKRTQKQIEAMRVLAKTRKRGPHGRFA